MVINIQDDILRLHAMGLLDRLLADKATRGNIMWATDAYAQLGEWYSPGNEIRPQRITGDNSDLIKTRARRAMEQRTERTRQHAEVFTPLWVVKKMNDFADVQWFKRKSGIYKLTDEGKIYFSKDKHWKLYVDARRMEITCGEAPFLVTRYDVETGEAIPIEDRIGLLDRKLRAVAENTQDIEEWKTWALRAVQAIYGYELQGDNLLIARVNILCSVKEHMFHRWRQRPDKAWLEKLCNAIAWNLWQMDGIKGSVPVPPRPTEEQLSLFPPLHEQTNLFGEMEEQDISCRLYDWRGDRSLSYSRLRKKGSELMKFDFIIGNPPYQDETLGDNKGFAPPIYHLFMDGAYEMGKKVELIHPARFLFNAGSTSKAWNEKMLSDPHLKVIYYEPDASKLFSNTEIKGGIAITYHDANRDFGKIGTFTAYPELNAILRQVHSHSEFQPLSSIAVSSYAYHFTEKLHQDYPEAIKMLSKGHAYDLKSNVFSSIPMVFHDQCPSESFQYIQILGRLGTERKNKYIKADYITPVRNLYKWKAYMPKANSSGALGEVLSPSIIAGPGIGSTETFMGVGCFDSETEARNLEKYIKTKLFRILLGVLKTTQDLTPQKLAHIPLQDFTPDSDIDWSKSIPEIDQQLYRKYGLDEKEIAFIESHVKEMS